MTDSDGSDIEIIEVQASPEVAETGQTPTHSDFRTLQCPVCLEIPEIVAVAGCGHIYCHECVYPALSSGRHATKVEGECSICRKRVRYTNTLYMEFKKGSVSPASGSSRTPTAQEEQPVPRKEAPQKNDLPTKSPEDEEYDREIDRAMSETLL